MFPSVPRFGEWLNSWSKFTGPVTSRCEILNAHRNCPIEKTFQELPNWTFWADEVSAGCYRVKGTNSLFGSNLELTGENPEESFDEAKLVAEGMERQVRAKLNRS
jgi:hypothetical protein